MIERTVSSGFDMPLVDLVRARVQRRLKQTADAEASYRKVIERAGDESEWACQAWGELALMKDAQEDYAGAVECIERCKHTQRRHEGRHWTAAQRLHGQVRELIATISRADFARWRTEAEQLPPCRTALLTGFPRSGTTLLEQVLDAHPQLVSSEERDFIGQEFFYASLRGRLDAALLPAINELSIAQIEKDRQRYFQGMEYLLGQPIGPRMHLDKNPAYNLTIPFMLRAFPQTRLIVALRDPRDVIVSCYLRYLPLNGVSVCFLDPRRTAERYALDMTAWLKFRDLIETPWRQVRYEDVVSDMPGEARRTLELLDLPWDDAVLNYRDRLTADKRVTSPSYEAVAQPVYTKAVGRWRHYAAALEPALDILEPFVREFGYN